MSIFGNGRLPGDSPTDPGATGPEVPQTAQKTDTIAGVVPRKTVVPEPPPPPPPAPVEPKTSYGSLAEIRLPFTPAFTVPVPSVPGRADLRCGGDRSPRGGDRIGNDRCLLERQVVGDGDQGGGGGQGVFGPAAVVVHSAGVNAPTALFPGLLGRELGTLYDVFASEYDVVVTSGEQTVRADNADGHVARVLGVARRAPLLVLERTTFAGRKVVELSWSAYRADRYRLHMALTPRGPRSGSA